MESPPPANEPAVRLIPLGGLGEIGLNMMLVESGDELIAIDCGLMFPDPDEMPGIDHVIPDFSYALAKRDGFRAVFLTHGQRLAKALRLDKLFRLKTLPVNLSLPWILNVGDFFGHLPLPAKITVQVMEPIDLRERYGSDPDIDDVYEDVTRLMQDQLSELAAERRLPILG